MTTLEIENIGPVTHATIPVPENGGVVVLRGRNGSGKTRTLDAVENLISGRGKPTVRDGALSGSVSGFGVTLNLARSARRSGELEVTSLDGRLSVAELVDPGLKSPDAADSKRIKALIAVSGIKPSVDLFYDLFGGRDAFESIVSSGTLDASDLVSMADKVKRDCEAAARKAESEADHEEGRARGATEAANSAGEGEDDADVLQAALESAIANKSKISEQAEASQKANAAAELARHRLTKADEEYDGESLAAAKEKATAAVAALEAATAARSKAQAALDAAELEEERARVRNEVATDAMKNAERHESLLAQWREQIDIAIPPMPTEYAITLAAQKVTAARSAVETGAVIRAAKAKRKEAEEHAQQALSHRKRATKLRHVAKGTDEVLSNVVSSAGSPLKVEAGRLVLDTKRGATYFADLSHGERWRIALDVAINAVGKGGVIVLHQEAWEGLDPMAREAIVDQVKGSEVVILTAECSSDDGVNAEVF